MFSVGTINSIILLKLVLEVMYRLCLVSEEISHISSRYDKSKISLIINAFTFSKSHITLTVVSLLVSMYTFTTTNSIWKLLCGSGCISNLCSYAGVSLIIRVLHLVSIFINFPCFNFKVWINYLKEELNYLLYMYIS